jgi:hypothetical protein
MWMAANMVAFNRDGFEAEESKTDNKIKRSKLNRKAGKAYIPKQAELVSREEERNALFAMGIGR